MKLKTKLTREKPWVRLGMSRKKYEAHRPWKRTKPPMTRAAFEEMLEIFPPEAVKLLKEEADAEALLQAIFGEAEKEI